MAEKMPLISGDIRAERITRLREDFPEVFSEGKVDFDRLKEALSEEVAEGRERYGLSWAGKSEAVRNIQTPSVATLVPDRDESVEFDATENLFIEGDNLEVLKLLQKGYHGRVKMIYIDPPYNTGNEFIYPDNFREGIDDYLRYSGQVSGDGIKLSTNTETGGRYHSRWLNMMYPRLFLARNLLREDGVIFVSIDDHEIHNLRHLMDEIFGPENFLASVLWQKKYAPSNDTVDFSAAHDFILVYSKTRFYAENGKATALLSKLDRTERQDSAYKNPDSDLRGPWKAGDYTCNKSAEEHPNLYYPIRQPNTGEEAWPSKTRVWAYSREENERHANEDRIWWGVDGQNRVPAYKRFLSEVGGIIADTWWSWDEVGHTDESKKEIKKLLPDVDRAFDTPKPTRLLRRMLQLASISDDEDIVLDFFAGPGSTAHAVLDANEEDNGNRKFIMVQLPERTTNPNYSTVAHIGKERIRRVIKKLNDEKNGKLQAENAPLQDRGFKVFKLASSNFKIWDGTGASEEPEDLAKQLQAFAENVLPDRSREDILYEILLKSGLPLTAEVERLEVAGREIYAVSGGLLMVCLEDHVDDELMRAVVEHGPERFVCLDTAFDGNDKLKTNTVLQMKDHGIEFRTV